MKKRLFLLLTIALALVGAQSVAATELKMGLKEPEVIDIPYIEPDEEVIEPEKVTESVQAQESEWDKYKSYYYYNQLSPELKETWDALDAICETYYSETKDVPNYYTAKDENNVEYKMGYTEWVTLSEPMLSADLRNFWCVYIYSNPQYYFLCNSYMRAGGSGDTDATKTYSMLSLVVYDAFWDGATRAAETEKVKAQLAAWQTEIDKCTTEAEKLRKIQELICAKVDYNDAAAADEIDEQESFSQSPYSVLCGDLTVCAGYADTLYMLCNASGIDAISVTSPNHQWNKVRIGDSWYNCDATWDDEDTGSAYISTFKYFGRNDACYDTDNGSDNANNIYAHTEQTYWDKYLPLCTLDTSPVSPYTSPGTFQTVSRQVEVPEIVLAASDENTQVTLSCVTEGASLYYTVDGTDPSAAESKSYKYTESFTAEPGAVVKARAVCDTYLDSEVVSRTIPYVGYAISYNLDGGINHLDNPDTYTAQDEVILQTPSKLGYVFEGWYTDSTFSQSVTKISAGSKGAKTFYAKWSPISYMIVYAGNGANGGAVASQADCLYDTGYELSKNTFTKTGHVFTGWNTAADGSGTSYADGAEVKNLASNTGEVVILYAQWEVITYTIRYDGNGATSGEVASQTDCEYGTTYTLKTNNYKKTGYTFVGWNTTSDGQGKSYSEEAEIINLTIEDGKEIFLYAHWKPISYFISFDPNGGGSGNVDLSEYCRYDTEYALPKNTFTKAGYVFTGWNTKADGSGTSFADGEIVSNLTTTCDETVILYAQWRVLVYTIVYDGNGADSGEVASQDCEYGEMYTLNSNQYFKTGYRFAGWNTAADGNGTLFSEDAQINNLSGIDGEEVTLYAYWAPISYKIAYNGNGSESGIMTVQSACSYDKTYTLKANVYSRTGYVFAGWNTAADGSGTTYADGASVSNLTSTFGETITLYAQWEPICYTIVYDGNGSESEKMPPQEGCIYDAAVVIKENLYTKSGYMFDGWNSKNDGSGTEYIEGDEVENLTSIEGEEVVLYAQWKPIVYTIAYDGNGADSGEMTAQSGCNYDVEYSLSSNTYVKEACDFASWNTEADGSGTSYADKATVKNLTAANGATVTLYACWAPVNYSICFDGNDATSGSVSAMTELVRGEEYVLPANAYSRTGYLFSGWNTKVDGSGTAYEDGAAVCNVNDAGTGEVVLYAQWEPITYTIHYSGKGGSGTMSSQENCKYDTTYELSPNLYTKTGYLFAGWNTKTDGTGTAYADGAEVKNLTASDGDTIRLYAQWQPIVYSIGFDGNGSSGEAMAPMTDCSYATTYALTKNSYTRTGYTFAGWNTAVDGSGKTYDDGEKVKNLTAVNAGTVTLYAQWKVNCYTIHYDGNGSEVGTMSSQENCKYGTAYTLPECSYSKTGYVFAGWSTEPIGNGMSYPDKAEVKNLANEDGAKITLYAQWERIAYTIAYDGNGSESGVMASHANCNYGMSYTLRESVYKRSGYIFAGWNTQPDGKGVPYADKAEVKNLTATDGEIVTIYAQWAPIAYTIVYDGNGSDGGTMSEQKNCAYGLNYKLSESAYTRAGYTFTGWNTAADGSGVAYAENAVVKNLTKTDGTKITLYAQWKPNVYTIRYDGNKATKGSMDLQTSLEYGKDYILLTNMFKRTGYTFTGWNTKSDGKGTGYKNKSAVQNLSAVNGEVITLYAQWKANSYKVKFNGNGATSGSMKIMKNRSYGKKFKLSANKFKKKGYKFVGWNTKKNGKGKMYKNKAKVKNLTSKNGKTVTLYAQWKKIK